MEFPPFFDHSQCPSGKITGDRPCLDLNGDLVFVLDGVEVWRRMVPRKDTDDNSQESRDFWHDHRSRLEERIFTICRTHDQATDSPPCSSTRSPRHDHPLGKREPRATVGDEAAGVGAGPVAEEERVDVGGIELFIAS